MTRSRPPGTSGRVRNPIFTGLAMVSARHGAHPTAASVLSLLCLVIAIQIQVRVTEEPYLARVHGRSYTDYMARTGRFLPKLTRP